LSWSDTNAGDTVVVVFNSSPKFFELLAIIVDTLLRFQMH
jgi:hypothetical protein